MAAQMNSPHRMARQSRLALAHEATDRLDICRHLLKAEPVSCRLALVLQLLDRTVDDVAALAGDPEAEARQREAIRRAAEPPRVDRRRRAPVLEVLAAVSIAIVVGGLVLRWAQ